MIAIIINKMDDVVVEYSFPVAIATIESKNPESKQGIYNIKLIIKLKIAVFLPFASLEGRFTLNVLYNKIRMIRTNNTFKIKLTKPVVDEND